MEIQDRPLNHRFTQNYAQPKEYHFCLDSVLLPKLVADLTREKLPSSSAVLDLGAGCGVLGLEFLYYRPDIRQLDFIEKQEFFAPYFRENLARFREHQDSPVQCEYLLKDLRSIGSEAGATTNHSYDLILCNPPYYFEDEGTKPPQNEKAQCHFFLSAGPDDFLNAIAVALKSGGEAYVLVKNPSRWKDAIEATAESLSVEQVATIRGTAVYKFTRTPVAFATA